MLQSSTGYRILRALTSWSISCSMPMPGNLSMVVKRQRELKQYLPEPDILSLCVKLQLGSVYPQEENSLQSSEDSFFLSLLRSWSKWATLGSQRSWQQRRSASLNLSPDICGGQPESESDLRSLGTIIKLSRLWGKKQQF